MFVALACECNTVNLGLFCRSIVCVIVDSTKIVPTLKGFTSTYFESDNEYLPTHLFFREALQFTTPFLFFDKNTWLETPTGSLIRWPKRFCFVENYLYIFCSTNIDMLLFLKLIMNTFVVKSYLTLNLVSACLFN